MLRYVVFNATHFAKGVGTVYMASRQEIKFFRLAVVKFTHIFFFFTGTPSDSTPIVRLTSRICYLRRNLQRNGVVGCQVEVTNGLKLVYRVDCVR